MSDAELMTLGLTSRVLFRGYDGDVKQLTSVRNGPTQLSIASCRLSVSPEHSMPRLPALQSQFY